MSALNKKSFLTYLKEGGIYVLLVLLAIIIFQDPTFLSLLNLSNILTQSSVRIIIALGVAGLIVTQGTDLSAGRQVGLAAVIAATMLQAVDNANKVPGYGDHADPAGDPAGVRHRGGHRPD
jgi:methyl-galactoside transport system permease protein